MDWRAGAVAVQEAAGRARETLRGLRVWCIFGGCGMSSESLGLMLRGELTARGWVVVRVWLTVRERAWERLH